MKSVKGKYLCEFPELVSELDLRYHKNLDVSKIKAGSNTKLNWVCKICNETYLRYPNHRTRDNSACPKRECVLIKRTNTNSDKFGWEPKYHLPKREPVIKKEVPEPSDSDVEIWKEIPKEMALSKYLISSLGRIKNKRMNHIHSQKPQSNGYDKKTLYIDNGKNKCFCIHRIVAITFITNPKNKETVNHINTIRHDNRVVNLEWATNSEQGLGENRSNNIKGFGKSIDQYDLKDNFIKTWIKAIDIENELGIQRKNVSAVVRGKRKTDGGFKWKYTEIKDLENEVWKQIEDSESYVSNLGRVKLKIDKNPNYGTLIKSGYRNTKIYINGKHKSFLVHRLVALTFIPNHFDKPVVNHIDENRSNNKLDNLEWVTYSENSIHSTKEIKKNCRSKIVQRIDKNNIIEEYPSIHQAGKNNELCGQTIYDRCVGRYNQSGNYIWKFKINV